MTKEPGSTGVSVDVLWLDDNGFGVTGKVAADFPAVKWSSGTNTADTTITLSDLALITTPHPNNNVAGGVKEREGGRYRLDLPNNMFTDVGNKCLTFAETTNKRLSCEPIEVRSVALPGSAMTLTSGERSAIAQVLLDLNDAIEAGWTLRQAMRIILSDAAGQRSNCGTNLEQYDAVGSPGTPRIVGNLDSNGNGLPTLTP